MRKKIVSSILIGVMLCSNLTAYAAEPLDAAVATGTDASMAVETQAEDIEESMIETTEAEDTELSEDGLQVQAAFADINADSVFLKQTSGGTCTLIANINMLRRNALIHGDTAWQEITEASARPEIWIEGTGMKWNYQYRDTAVKRRSLSDMTGEEKSALFREFLKTHPEGVVIHQDETDKGYPHAVLLTDYTDGVFYCADPSNEKGLSGKRIPLTDTVVSVENSNQYWYVSEPGVLDDGIAYANPGGILTTKEDHTGYEAGVVVNTKVDKNRIEYSWYASKDDGETYTCISDWRQGNEWVSWVPDSYGNYKIMAKTRVDGKDASIQEVYTDYFRPLIKGKCQMPYTGKGGGFLIGFETYENPDQKYSYEVLILDCTLLAQNKPAWVYTTGKCHMAEGNAIWTVWQPQYGYYWTLFRVYDENGIMLDEQCYGFQNIG